MPRHVYQVSMLRNIGEVSRTDRSGKIGTLRTATMRMRSQTKYQPDSGV